MKRPFKALGLRAIAWICSVGIVWFGLTASANADTEVGTSGQATLYRTDGSSELLGTATFVPVEDGLQVNVALSDVPPGYHGFHIHALGSCDDAGMAAGGHFNPLDARHGYLPEAGLDEAHAGDLGNILILSNGSGTLQITAPDLTVTDGDLAIADHAVILHAARDDFGQPTGNAGGRIACGIIERVNQSE